MIRYREIETRSTATGGDIASDEPNAETTLEIRQLKDIDALLSQFADVGLDCPLEMPCLGQNNETRRKMRVANAGKQT